MTVEHSVIADAELHQPLGAFGATARQTIVANGSAGTSWKTLSGWANYADNAKTSGAPLVVSSATRTQLTNNGLGGATDESRLPGIWNESTGKLDSTLITAGDYYDLRLIFSCKAAGTTDKILIDIDTGSVVLSQHYQLLNPSNATNVIMLTAPLFADAALAANGATIYATPSASTSVWDIGVLVSKHFAD